MTLEKRLTFPWKKIMFPGKKIQPLAPGKTITVSFSGSVVLWSCGPVLLSSCGPLVLWSCSEVLWPSGPVVPWQTREKKYVGIKKAWKEVRKKKKRGNKQIQFSNNK